MNSMMLIGNSILRRACWRPPALRALALDACAARGSDDRRMHYAGSQDHPVAGLQLEPLALAFEHEGDRPVHAVQDLLVRVAVGGIAIVRSIRPRVAGDRLPAQRGHEILQPGHAPLLRWGSVLSRKAPC